MDTVLICLAQVFLHIIIFLWGCLQCRNVRRSPPKSKQKVFLREFFLYFFPFQHFSLFLSCTFSVFEHFFCISCSVRFYSSHIKMSYKYFEQFFTQRIYIYITKIYLTIFLFIYIKRKQKTATVYRKKQKIKIDLKTELLTSRDMVLFVYMKLYRF